MRVFSGTLLPEWDDPTGADAWLVAAFLRLCARLGSLFLFVVGVILIGVGYAILGIALLFVFFLIAAAWLLEEQDYC